MRHVYRSLSDGGHRREVIGRREDVYLFTYTRERLGILLIVSKWSLTNSSRSSPTRGIPTILEKSVASSLHCFQGIPLMFMAYGWKVQTFQPLKGWPSPPVRLSPSALRHVDELMSNRSPPKGSGSKGLDGCPTSPANYGHGQRCSLETQETPSFEFP